MMTKFFGGTVLAVMSFTAAHAYQWKTLEKVDYAWSGGSKPDHFTLEIPEKWNDPGDFLRLRVEIGEADYVFDQLEGIKPFAPLTPYLAPGSTHLAFVKLQPKEPSSLLFIQDYPYASGPGRVTVLGLHGKGYVPYVLFQGSLNVHGFADVDGDGDLEMLADVFGGEIFGKDNRLHSYNPEFVYKLKRTYPKSDYTMELVKDVALSKKHNLDTGYGWAGEKYTADWVVLAPKDGKGAGRLMRKSEAEKILKSEK